MASSSKTRLRLYPLPPCSVLLLQFLDKMIIFAPVANLQGYIINTESASGVILDALFYYGCNKVANNIYKKTLTT